jgi:hypothetical protein
MRHSFAKLASVDHGNMKMTPLSRNSVSPLNPPLEKGEAVFPPFLKGGSGGIFFVPNNLQSSILNLQSLIAGLGQGDFLCPEAIP